MVLILISSLSAQSVGDKVTLILKNGSEIHGVIKDMDANMIYLDLSAEYKSSAGGSIGIQKSLIDKIEKVKELMGEKDKVSIEEIKARLDKENGDVARREEEIRAADSAKVVDTNKRQEEDKKKTGEADAAKKMDDLAAELQLLKDFPPGQNSEAYPYSSQSDLMNYPITGKWDNTVYTNLVNQFTTIKVPLNAKQQKFVDNYDAWKQAVQDSDKLKSQMQNSAPGSGDNTAPPSQNQQTSPSQNKQGGLMYDPSANAFAYYYPGITVYYPYPYYVTTVAIIPPSCYHTPCNEHNIRRDICIRNPRVRCDSNAFATQNFSCRH